MLQARRHRCLMCRHQFTPDFPMRITKRGKNRENCKIFTRANWVVSVKYTRVPVSSRQPPKNTFSLPSKQLSLLWFVFSQNWDNRPIAGRSTTCHVDNMSASEVTTHLQSVQLLLHTRPAPQTRIVFFLLSQTYRRYPLGFWVNQGHWRGSHRALEHVVGIMQR